MSERAVLGGPSMRIAGLFLVSVACGMLTTSVAAEPEKAGKEQELLDDARDVLTRFLFRLEDAETISYVYAGDLTHVTQDEKINGVFPFTGFRSVDRKTSK